MLKHELLKMDGKILMAFNVPALHQGRKLPLGEFRKVIESFKFMESKIMLLKDTPPFVKGWATWTKHENEHIKTMIKKLGGKELKILDDRTWFSKELI